MKGGVLFNKKILDYFNSTPGYREGEEHSIFNRNYLILRIILGNVDPAYKPKITLLSKNSLYGYIFKIELLNMPQYVASLLNFKLNSGRADGFIRHITSFIIKLAFIGTHDTEIPYSTKYYNGKDEYIEEAKIQYDIYNRQYLIGQYYVPPILTREPLFLNQVEELLPGQNNKDAILTQLIESVDDAQFSHDLGNAGNADIGLIIMTFEEGYDILYNRDTIKNKLLCKFVHLLLCLEAGYYHGDPHQANVMVHPDYVVPHLWYKDDNTGRALLIDFGRTRPIPAQDMEAIKVLAGQKKFMEIITDYIYEKGIPIKPQYFKGYEWLKTYTPIEIEILNEMMTNYVTFNNTHPEIYLETVEAFQKRFYIPNNVEMSEGGRRTKRHIQRNKKRMNKKRRMTKKAKSFQAQ